jgi:hypothetical protein
VYNNNELLYKYKGRVDIPSLGMVGDIMTIQKCPSDPVKMNAVVNAFIESKKLTLSSSKCHRIHIQKNSNQDKERLKLKVHDELMKDSIQEEYLGDIVDQSGKIRNTVEDRRNKGYGIVAEILSMTFHLGNTKWRLVLC